MPCDSCLAFLWKVHLLIFRQVELSNAIVVSVPYFSLVSMQTKQCWEEEDRERKRGKKSSKRKLFPILTGGLYKNTYYFVCEARVMRYFLLELYWLHIQCCSFGHVFKISRFEEKRNNKRERKQLITTIITDIKWFSSVWWLVFFYIFSFHF